MCNKLHLILSTCLQNKRLMKRVIESFLLIIVKFFGNFILGFASENAVFRWAENWRSEEKAIDGKDTVACVFSP